MAIEWNKVTWYSKLVAVLLFVLVLPAWTFYIGRQYERAVQTIEDEGKINHLEFSKDYQQVQFRKENMKVNVAPQPGSVYSGIMGVSVVGPTCPVAQAGDTSCNDKPFEAHLVVKNTKGNVITETISRKDGSFALALEPGSYVIEQAKSSSQLPHLNPKTVTVPKDKVILVTLNFDSGIR